jgi:hypothetical protein
MHVKVEDLAIGQVFWFNDILAVVKEAKNDRVCISKITDKSEFHPGISVRFSSPYYEDLKNRVTLASANEIVKYLSDFNEKTKNARQRFMECFPK